MPPNGLGCPTGEMAHPACAGRRPQRHHRRIDPGTVRSGTSCTAPTTGCGASLALQCREIGLWPDKILIEVTCKDASKTGLAVCDRQARPRWRWSLTESGRALFDGLTPP